MNEYFGARPVPVETNDASSFTYDFSFADGPGAWRNWMAPTVVHGDVGAYSDYTRIHVAGDLDPNHIDGIGPIWLLSHLSLPNFGSPGSFDLTDATIELTVRSHDFDANGAGLYFWIIRYLPGTELMANYYVGLQSTNWAFTGHNLIDDLGEQWSTISVTLTADPAGWTYAGNNHSNQGDWAERYVEYPIADTLSHTDATIHLVFVGESPDKRPTGFIDIANISITSQTPANPIAHDIDQIVYGTEDQVSTGALDLPAGFDPDTAQFAVVEGTVVRGSVSVDAASGIYTLTPDANFWGPDRQGRTLTFSYTVGDATHEAVTRKVYAYIAPINDAPTTQGSNEDFTVEFGQQITMTLRKAVDVDVGDRATFAIDPASVQHGAIDLDARTGRYTFTPEDGFSGTASFAYTVTDGLETSAAKTVTVTVLADGESYAVPDINALTTVLVGGNYDGFVNGIIRLAATGESNAAYHLGTWLHYGNNVVQDTTLAAQLLGSAVGTVKDAAYQLGDIYTQGDGVPKDFAAARALYTALGTDATAQYRLGVLDDLGFGGPVDQAAAANHYLTGALGGNADAMYTLGRRYLAASGVEYQPDDAYFWLGVGLKFNGGPPITEFRNLLTYNQSQVAPDLTPERIGELQAAIAAWTPGTATPVNDVPLVAAAEESFVFDYARHLTGALLPGTDRDGNSLTFVAVDGSVTGGTVTIDPNTGAFDFSPGNLFVGTASFSYVLSDGQDQSAEKTVTLEIRAVTLAEDDTAATTEQDTVASDASVLANDLLDADASTLTVVAVEGDAGKVGTAVSGSYGTLTLEADGSYSYTADAPQLVEGQTVVDSFTYTLVDDLGTQSTASLRVTIAGVSGTVLTGSGRLVGSAFDDVITGDAGANELVGLAGKDTLDGGGGSDTLIGGEDDDTYLVRSAGTSIIEAMGEGVDLVRAYSASFVLPANVENMVFAGSGDFIGIGNALDNAIVGGAGADTLNGGDGNDTLDGGAGNDVLIGGLGTNTLVGGSGTDLAYYGDASGAVIASLSDGTASGTAFSDTLVAIENLYGSSFGDSLTGNGGSNVLTGAAGDDALYGLNGDDILIGGTGNDLLDGGLGADRMEGGAGDDRYVVDNAGDTVVELAGAGTDTVLTTLAAYTLGANVENLTYTGSAAFTGTGNALDNVIAGGAGNDVLIGGVGNDTLVGGAGIDTASYAAAAAGIVLKLAQGVASSDGDGGSDTLSGIENVIGSAFDDTIIGDALDNRIEGGLGRDVLIGGAGNDVLVGGTGLSNQMQGGLGDDTYVVSVATDTLVEFANEGTDTVQTALSSFTLKANIENLTYTGGSAFAGTGNEFDNVITGGAGNDVLIGGAGNDTLVGGAGVDTASYAAAAAGIVIKLAQGIASSDGDGGSDTLSGIENVIGSAFDDTIVGDALDNRIEGGLGRDVLIGGAGNDVLVGGTGLSNQMQGGLGDDTYVVSVPTDTLVEFTNEGTDTVQTALSSFTLKANIENLTYIGTGAFTGTGNALDNIITGGAGNDLFDGGLGADRMEGGAGDDRYVVDNAGDTVVELAGAGTDTVLTALAAYTLGANVENLTFTGTGAFTGTGNALDNIITGGVGNDLLVGGAGNDRLVGGAGIDTASYAAAAAGIVIKLAQGIASSDGDGGSDTLSAIENVIGSAFDDTIIGDALDNRIEGGLGRDVLIGGAGNDVLVGGTGLSNQMQGGLGDDTYVVSVATDTLVEFANEGTDTVETALSSFTLKANIENLTYTGTGAFTGTGNELDNVITGSAGNDMLSGAAGNDTLIGGAGSDRLTGGTGADTFVFAPTEGGADQVSDFEAGVDKLLVSAAQIAPGDAFTFTTDAAQATTGPTFLYDQATGALSFDADGTGGQDAVVIAQLAPFLDLTANDFGFY